MRFRVAPRRDEPVLNSLRSLGIQCRTSPKQLVSQPNAIGVDDISFAIVGVSNLEERLKHASEAKKLMLAKFKTSLVEGPAAIEKRQQRQAIAAARAERAVQREEARQRQERELVKQAEIGAQAAADAARAAADEAAREAAEQAERNALLEAEQKATRDARYAARKAAKKKRRRGY